MIVFRCQAGGASGGSTLSTRALTRTMLQRPIYLLRARITGRLGGIVKLDGPFSATELRKVFVKTSYKIVEVRVFSFVSVHRINARHGSIDRPNSRAVTSEARIR